MTNKEVLEKLLEVQTKVWREYDKAIAPYRRKQIELTNALNEVERKNYEQ